MAKYLTPEDATLAGNYSDWLAQEDEDSGYTEDDQDYCDFCGHYIYDNYCDECEEYVD